MCKHKELKCKLDITLSNKGEHWAKDSEFKESIPSKGVIIVKRNPHTKNTAYTGRRQVKYTMV
jgi:hypothetical protein